MKKICGLVLLFAIVCCALLSVGNVFALADDVYYMVEQDNTIQLSVYSDFGVLSTFYVPAGYTIACYGTATNEGVDYAKVRFGGLTGYVPQSQITTLSYAGSVVELPRVSVQVDGGTAYRFRNNTREAFNLTKDDALFYVGNASFGDVAYYAVCKQDSNEVFFVVQSHTNQSEIQDAVYPKQAEEPVASEPADVDVVAQPKQGFTWMRVALIMGIIIPLITIVVMIIRPRRTHVKQGREIYEDSDDYDGIDEV